MVSQEQDAFKVLNIIFNEPPKEPNTFNLRLDDSNPENANVKMDDILINVFFNGLKTLFGENNLTNITQEQYNHINKYMHSLGYNTIFDYEYDENNNPTRIKIWFESLRNTF